MPSVVYSVVDGKKFAAAASLVVVSCWTCGMPYAIPENLHRSALKHRGDQPNGWKLCCPLGHTWWYVGRNEEERLRARAGLLAAERDQLQASLRAQRAATTRARNEKARLVARVANGVCPCCGRTFSQLARHMAAKHPDFVDEAKP